MKFSIFAQDSQQSSISMLIGLAIILGFMYWARVIVIPVALSILITFLLIPAVNRLENIKIPRVPSVVLVTIVALSVFLGASYAITRQINTLVDTYPEYEDNIKTKISQLNENGRDSLIDKIRNVSERLYLQLEEARKNSKGLSANPDDVELQKASPVKVVDETPFRLNELGDVLGPVLEPIANAGLVIVLVIFMLINREDLRDRFISLIGVGRMTDTTRALSDASERISRYLLVQLLINCGYGVAVGVGLWVLDVPYPILWGGFAALLRYIPYLGAWLSALLPIALSLLISPEWTIAIKVIALFLVLELITNMIVEPVLYGRGIGVSQAALLVAVAFWTWLWGPIGMILASPLTVCLAVLGRYVPFLGFLDILLGDKPTLSVDHRYYQRLLADDEDEASEIVEEHIKDHSIASALDQVIIPALSLARSDLRANKLDEEDHNRITILTKSILEDQRFGEIVEKSQTQENIDNLQKDNASIDLPKSIVLAIPAKNDIPDQLMVDVLENIIDSNRIDLIPLPSGIMVSDILRNIEEKSPKLLVILSIPPGGMTHIRYICKRVKAGFPKLRIIVGRLGVYEEERSNEIRKLDEIKVKHVQFDIESVVSEIGKLSVLEH